MKGKIQIYHHLGLGDHIICNGLVRELCKQHEKIYCFVKSHYLSSVSFMYRDEPKIELIAVHDNWEVPSKINKNIDLMEIRLKNFATSDDEFDQNFYRHAGFDFKLRWDNFYLERDHAIERELLGILNPNNAPYVFVHDDPSRGLSIDLSMVRKDRKIIRVADCFAGGTLRQEFRKYNLFHWILLLERATEIHCMDSSFKCLVESLPNLDDATFFFHRYVKGPHAVCTTRKNWIVIDRPSVFFMAKKLTRRIHRKSLKLWHAQVVQPNQRPSSQ